MRITLHLGAVGNQCVWICDKPAKTVFRPVAGGVSRSRRSRRERSRSLLQITLVGRNVESEVSAFLVIAAAHSAIAKNTRLVVSIVSSIEIAFFAPVDHASSQRWIFRVPAFRNGFGGGGGNGRDESIVNQAAKIIVLMTFF